MEVNTLKVSYLREKQPKEYEKAAPSVEFSAALDIGEDPVAAGLKLMSTACQIVYAAIGMDIPEAVLAKLGAGFVPTGGIVTATTTAKAPVKEPEVAAADTAKATETAPAADKPKRGRPPTKKTEPVSESGSDLPPDDATVTQANKPAISTGGERTNPDDDFPPEEEKTEEQILAEMNGEEETVKPPSAEELQTFISKSVAAKTVTVAEVKELLGSLGVARTSDVKEPDRQKVMDKIVAIGDRKKKA